MNIHTLLRLTTILTLGLIVSAPGTSRADTIYNAIAIVDLRITGFSNMQTSKPDDVVITGSGTVVDNDSIFDGHALAEQFAESRVIEHDTHERGFNEGLSQAAIATGNTTLGTAVSFAFTQGILAINNLSLTEGYTVNFSADYSYLVDANAINSNLEFASATSEISLESRLLGSLLDLTVSADSDFAGGVFSDNAVLPFSIFVEPGESEVLTLSVHAAGSTIAVAPVPEPSTLALFATGIIGTSIFQWRKNTRKQDLRRRRFSQKDKSSFTHHH